MQTARKIDYAAYSGAGYSTEEKRQEALEILQNKKFVENAYKRMLLKVLFMAGLILIILVGFVAYGASIRYQTNITNTEIAKLQEEIKALNLEVTAKVSPAAIETRAIQELGMEYPTASQYVYINSFNEEVASVGSEN